MSVLCNQTILLNCENASTLGFSILWISITWRSNFSRAISTAGGTGKTQVYFSTPFSLSTILCRPKLASTMFCYVATDATCARINQWQSGWTILKEQAKSWPWDEIDDEGSMVANAFVEGEEMYSHDLKAIQNPKFFNAFRTLNMGVWHWAIQAMCPRCEAQVCQSASLCTINYIFIGIHE